MELRPRAEVHASSKKPFEAKMKHWLLAISIGAGFGTVIGNFITNI